MTEAPFEDLEQQELKDPESLLAEHNKERVWRRTSVSSLFTQGMVKVRERTTMMKERKDMEMKWKREKGICEKVMEIINDKNGLLRREKQFSHSNSIVRNEQNIVWNTKQTDRKLLLIWMRGNDVWMWFLMKMVK